MKFQNPSMHGYDMAYIKKRGERTHARMDGRMHGQPETSMPRQLLRSWGHNYLK